MKACPCCGNNQRFLNNIWDTVQNIQLFWVSRKICGSYGDYGKDELQAKVIWDKSYIMMNLAYLAEHSNEKI